MEQTVWNINTEAFNQDLLQSEAKGSWMVTRAQKLCFATVIGNMYLLYAYSFQMYSNWDSERSANEVK